MYSASLNRLFPMSVCKFCQHSRYYSYCIVGVGIYTQLWRDLNIGSATEHREKKKRWLTVPVPFSTKLLYLATWRRTLATTSTWMAEPETRDWIKDKSVGENSDATTEGDRLTSTLMKPTHCLPSTTNCVLHYNCVSWILLVCIMIIISIAQQGKVVISCKYLSCI